MAQSTSNECVERQRRVADARAWIKQGYVTKAKVDELMVRIAKARGARAAEQLLSDMREQWTCRGTWLENGDR